MSPMLGSPDDAHGTDAPGTTATPSPWREAVRAWESRRIAYNAVLGAVFALLAARTWSRLAPDLTPGNLLRLAGLAAIMNVCYSAAYLAEPVIQPLAPRLRNGTRGVLWVGGTVFAVLLETYWYLDEILPPVR